MRRGARLGLGRGGSLVIGRGLIFGKRGIVSLGSGAAVEQ
jgi:hypothetical protein